MNWTDAAGIVTAIGSRATEARGARAVVAAISGIDGSGKTHIADAVTKDLRERGLRVAPIALDHWHTPPAVRFSRHRPGAHFYEHAYRFDELFSLLVEPLRAARSLRLEVELMRLPENDVFRHVYDFASIDVILLEGIFLLRRHLRRNYDLACWVECSFETALARALERNQEGLTSSEILRDYEAVYFAAQRIHIEADTPRESADLALWNDDLRPRLDAK